MRQQSPSARSRKPLLYPLSYGGPAGRAAERWFPFEPSIQRIRSWRAIFPLDFANFTRAKLDCDVRCNPEPGSRSIG